MSYGEKRFRLAYGQLWYRADPSKALLDRDGPRHYPYPLSRQPDAHTDTLRETFVPKRPCRSGGSRAHRRRYRGAAEPTERRLGDPALKGQRKHSTNICFSHLPEVTTAEFSNADTV